MLVKLYPFASKTELDIMQRFVPMMRWVEIAAV